MQISTDGSDSVYPQLTEAVIRLPPLTEKAYGQGAFRDLIALHENDYGGADAVTEVERSLVRRVEFVTLIERVRKNGIRPPAAGMGSREGSVTQQPPRHGRHSYGRGASGRGRQRQRTQQPTLQTCWIHIPNFQKAAK
jgi:hypothetical protein